VDRKGIEPFTFPHSGTLYRQPFVISIRIVFDFMTFNFLSIRFAWEIATNSIRHARFHGLPDLVDVVCPR